MPLPASADLGCETLLGLYDTAWHTIDAMLQAPLELLALADGLLAYPFEQAGQLLDQALALADFLTFDLSVSGMLHTLTKLLDCPFVADSPLGAQLAGAIDMLERTGNLPAEAVGTLQNAMRSRVGGLLDQVRDTPVGALSTLDDAYDALLERSGVQGALSELRALENCLREACAGYDALAGALPGSSDDILASIRGGVDAAGNVVTDVVGKAEHVPAAAREGYARMRGKMADAMDKAGQIIVRPAA